MLTVPPTLTRASCACACVDSDAAVRSAPTKPNAVTGSAAPSITAHPGADALPSQPAGDPAVTPPSSGVAVAPASAPTTATGPHVRHGGFTGPLVVPTHSARPTNTATTATTAAPKSSARPLDERDPYAP